MGNVLTKYGIWFYCFKNSFDVLNIAVGRIGLYGGHTVSINTKV